MNKNLTEIVFILDRSGSMSGLESDTIGGFNAMIEKHRLYSYHFGMSMPRYSYHAEYTFAFEPRCYRYVPLSRCNR